MQTVCAFGSVRLALMQETLPSLLNFILAYLVANGRPPFLSLSKRDPSTCREAGGRKHCPAFQGQLLNPDA